jgi:hypothetical protein
MTDMLMSVDATIDLLLKIARERGTATVSVFPICMEVDFVKGLPVWYLDGDKATEQQVRAAWAKARAGHPPTQSIAQRSVRT